MFQEKGRQIYWCTDALNWDDIYHQRFQAKMSVISTTSFESSAAVTPSLHTRVFLWPVQSPLLRRYGVDLDNSVSSLDSQSIQCTTLHLDY